MSTYVARSVAVVTVLGMLGALGAGTAHAQQQPRATHAQPRATKPAPKSRPAPGATPGIESIDIANGLDLSGTLRGAHLLFFLERAQDELERASLEQRSFISHLVRSLDDEAL